MTQFIPLNTVDLKNLFDFAAPIWRECYKNIIPEAQIEQLISKYFDYTNIQSFLKQGMIYEYILHDSARAGFIAYLCNSDHIYLDKLYLLKEYRGRHISRAVFSYLSDRYKKPIRLNVNKGNTTAIHTYKSAGFEIISTEDIPIENGFTNSDYIMEKPYTKSAKK